MPVVVEGQALDVAMAEGVDGVAEGVVRCRLPVEREPQDLAAEGVLVLGDVGGVAGLAGADVEEVVGPDHHPAALVPVAVAVRDAVEDHLRLAQGGAVPAHRDDPVVLRRGVVGEHGRLVGGGRQTQQPGLAARHRLLDRGQDLGLVGTVGRDQLDLLRVPFADQQRAVVEDEQPPRAGQVGDQVGGLDAGRLRGVAAEPGEPVRVLSFGAFSGSSEQAAALRASTPPSATAGTRERLIRPTAAPGRRG